MGEALAAFSIEAKTRSWKGATMVNTIEMGRTSFLRELEGSGFKSGRIDLGNLFDCQLGRGRNFGGVHCGGKNRKSRNCPVLRIRYDNELKSFRESVWYAIPTLPRS